MVVMCEACTSKTDCTTFQHIRVTSSEMAGEESRCTDWMQVKVDIRRAEFENGCQKLFQRAMEPVRRILETLDLDVDDIDEAVLVGGSSRIPLVRSELKQFLKLKSLNVDIDPDITVAYGAATVAQ